MINKKRKWILGTAAGLILALGVGTTAFCAPATPVYTLEAGAAVRDITPTQENGMLPIAAVGRTMAEGVIDPLHTRVIALSDGINKALIVSNETGKGPYGPLFAQELSEHTGVPLDAIFYTATHAHAAPEITNEIDMSYLTFEEDEEVDNLQKWGRLVYDQMMDAADEALANLEPVTMGIGYSNCYMNVNRNAKYTKADGTYYWAQGDNFEGFSDKTLAVMRFTSIETGKPVAFIMNYAIHGVVMYANQCLENGGTGISSDIGGYVCNALEAANDGAVAMFLIGAAGDQNPIYGNEIFAPDLEMGEKQTVNQGSLEILNWVGKWMYYDTKEAIKNIETETANADLAFEYGQTMIPSSEAGEYPVDLQVLRIGKVALVGFPGEMFNEIGAGVISQSPVDDTLWVNLCWTRDNQQTGYHSTDLITVEGGQGSNKKYLPGYLEDAAAELTRKLVAESLYFNQ
ncbi:MAG: hypothetical protein HFG96_05700 [Lachnospiraceae bacterium]|nr:hypothetical protein [Lachnospiraceae bacterium]